MTQKTKDYVLKASEGMISPEQNKARRFDDMRRLVLRLEKLLEEKKLAIKGFNESIEAVNANLIGLARQDDSQFQMDLGKKEDSDGGEGA